GRLTPMDETTIVIAIAVLAYFFMRNSNLPIYSGDPTYSYPNPLVGNVLSATSLSENGAAFIKQKEGLQLTPYWDVNGFSAGYGHHFQDGEPIPAVLTIEQADAYF